MESCSCRNYNVTLSSYPHPLSHSHPSSHPHTHLPTYPPSHPHPNTHLVKYVAPAQHHLGLGLHEGLVALVHVLEDVLSVVVEWVLHWDTILEEVEDGLFELVVDLESDPVRLGVTLVVLALVRDDPVLLQINGWKSSTFQCKQCNQWWIQDFSRGVANWYNFCPKLHENEKNGLGVEGGASATPPRYATELIVYSNAQKNCMPQWLFGPRIALCTTGPAGQLSTVTRMHSSRIHTTRSLTLSRSICQGVCVPTHTPLPLRAPYHAYPLPCTPPHHTCPLPCMPPCHTPSPWTEFLTHPCENITLPQHRCG